MDTLSITGQLILSLSILITLHEMGHFIPAKLFGTRVTKFYLFFDFLFPFPNVANFSLFKFTKGGTEYGIGWFPFGGYVQIAGMIDETTDKDDLEKEPQPWEFRSKPAWQRLIIMIGGVTVNFALAILIYSMVLFTWGKQYIPANNAVYGIHCDDLMLDLGFKDGDKIVALDGVKLADDMTIEAVSGSIILDHPSTVTVNRNGVEQKIAIPEDFVQSVLAAGVKTLLALRVPIVVDTVIAGNPAAEAGLLKGDSVIGINDVSTAYFSDLVNTLQGKKGETINLQIIRNGNPQSLSMEVTESGRIGFGNKNPTKFFDFEQMEYSFFGSFGAGLETTLGTLDRYVAQLPLIFTKEGVKQLGGFGTMAKMFNPEWNWHSFWVMTALISVILAFMNLLPVPMLDGGYVVFLIIEIIIRRPVPDRVVEIANMFGLAFVLLLLVYANGMDIFRGFFQ
ncbi:MAG: RIP metalloprotease RseP [Flavobacteriales bacterium]|nr:RIP metalloprotease RseP [Flavobacteriales bacterium]